jgi:signal transduction histidine kinase
MRARMTAQFALFVALLMLIGGAAIGQRERARAEARVRETLAIAKARARFEMGESEPHGHTILQVLRVAQGEISAGGLSLLVVDAQNRVLWQSRRYVPSWPRFGSDWRIATISRGGQTLVMARDWKPIEEELRQTAWTLAQLALLVIGATGLGAWVVVGRTLSPIHELAMQARDASTESPQVRLHPPSSDSEMRGLTATLNDLLARLERESQARGRFYAAASHELRTPIQGLLGKLDVAVSRSRSANEYHAIITGLQNSTERLATLVEDLLQLNALEMGQHSSPLETINLAFWVERALEQQSEEIEAKSLQVEARLHDVEIEAPSFHVEILLRNLLENAVKYATPNTSLRLGLSAAPDGANLHIENASDVPIGTDTRDWFEPFSRRDTARSSTGGNGLGLSIVAALARANGWKVELQTQKGGVLARVWLPKTPPTSRKPD